MVGHLVPYQIYGVFLVVAVIANFIILFIRVPCDLLLIIWGAILLGGKYCWSDEALAITIFCSVDIILVIVGFLILIISAVFSWGKDIYETAKQKKERKTETESEEEENDGEDGENNEEVEEGMDEVTPPEKGENEEKDDDQLENVLEDSEEENEEGGGEIDVEEVNVMDDDVKENKNEEVIPSFWTIVQEGKEKEEKEDEEYKRKVKDQIDEAEEYDKKERRQQLTKKLISRPLGCILLVIFIILCILNMTFIAVSIWTHTEYTQCDEHKNEKSAPGFFVTVLVVGISYLSVYCLVMICLITIFVGSLVLIFLAER